jgi:cbb3-type cytochrome oxidase cytochrome c subunit
MKSAALVFLFAFLALAASWGGFVLAPQVQLGRSMQTNSIGSEVLYPQPRPGMARQGAEVYRANGCVYCHSQQITQDGTTRDVVLTDGGTNDTVAIAALQELDAGLSSAAAKEILEKLPQTILSNASMAEADKATKLFEPAGAKVRIEIMAVGADIARGWGKRHSVAQDYLFDYPVQPGSRRIGPDLSNVGNWRPDANWQLIHLYEPKSTMKGSTMPPYPFLFEKRKIKGEPSPNALTFPDDFQLPEGYEVIPTEKAQMLVAYLQSLRSDAALYEAPITPPPAPATPETNAPTAAAASQ